MPAKSKSIRPQKPVAALVENWEQIWRFLWPHRLSDFQWLIDFANADSINAHNWRDIAVPEGDRRFIEKNWGFPNPLSSGQERRPLTLAGRELEEIGEVKAAILAGQMKERVNRILDRQLKGNPAPLLDPVTMKYDFVIAGRAPAERPNWGLSPSLRHPVAPAQPKPPTDLQDSIWNCLCSFVECLQGAEPKFPKVADIEAKQLGNGSQFTSLKDAGPEISSVFSDLGPPKEIDVPLKYLHRCPPAAGCGRLFWDRKDAIVCSEKCKKRAQRARRKGSRPEA